MSFFPEVSAGIIADKEVITANSAAPWSEDKAKVTRQESKTLDLLYISHFLQ